MIDGFVIYKGAWIRKSHPHLSAKMDNEDALACLRKGGLFLRNVYNFDKTDISSYWYVIKDSFGEMQELPTKVRNQVRKSLNTYDFKRVSKIEMQEKGLLLFNKSRERFHDKSLLCNQEVWNLRLEQEHLDFWIGYSKESNTPAAFAINSVYEDYCDYNTMGISPDFPNNTYPMYGLIYEMNRYYLEELQLKYVLDGARSITEHSNIQSFLEDKFKFRKAYCDLQLFYKPWLGVLIKCLFPFRGIITERRLKALLNQEAMYRGVK
jgi:hypothetical protein